MSTTRTNKKKAPHGKIKRTTPLSKTDAFMQQVLGARGRKQVAKHVAEECRRLLLAEDAWIVIVPPNGNKPFPINAPQGVQLAELPEGLFQHVADVQQAILYDARKQKPFQLFREDSCRLQTLVSSTALEKRRQLDLPWLGKAYQTASFLLLSLNPAFKQVRDPFKVAAKLLVIKKKNWTPVALQTLAAFLPMARMALSLTEQKKHLEKRLRQSTAASEIAQNINATMDVDILMRLILLEVTKAMRCQAGDIWLKNEKQTRLTFHSSLGLSTTVRGQFLTGECAATAMNNGEPLWIETVSQEPSVAREVLAGEGVVSLAVVPLKTKNKMIGVMHLFAKQQRMFLPEERVLLKTLVNQASTAIDNARLFEETKHRAKELLALYEVAQVISEMSNLNSALEQIVGRVSEVLNVEKCWFMFYSKESDRLSAHTSAVGLDEEQISALNLASEAPGLSTQVFRTAKPFFTNAAREEELVQVEFKNLFTLNNLMAVPLRSQEQTLGVFLAGNKRDQSNFAGNDVRLFRTLASEATVIIQNANLYDKLKRSYHSVVQVISDMVDAREPYTIGHSERVASYSATIAKQLKLPKEEVERIKLAGLLHDIGKIGISENILLKPGRLDAEEYTIMKRHSEIGVQILKNVEFPWEVKDLILHHHEHFNGKGYPGGLQGEAIPLGARIISVCDAFDVITSVRTYHQARTPWDAFCILIKDAGTQFDPKVIKAFEQVWPQLSEEIESRLQTQP